MATEHFQNPAMADNMHDRTDVEDWKRAFQRNLFYVLGRFPATATANDKYLALAYSVRDRLLERWVKTSETYYRKQARTVCYLSAEYLARPASRQQSSQPRGLGHGEAGHGGARPRFREAPRAGGGAGPRQRRSRAARRLLSRFARDARDPVDRLRHPLRIRDLRPADPRRLAGGDGGQVASPRQSVGDPAPGDRDQRRFRRPHGAVHRRERPLSRPLDSRARSSKASPTIRRSSDIGSTRRTCSACGARRRSIHSTSSRSTPATTTARSRRRSPPRRSARCSIRTTPLSRASSSGSSSSTSSSPARCRT